MILCDTNIIIEFYKNNSRVIDELRHIGLNQLAVSAISQAELYYGAINKVELNKIKKHLGLLHIFSVDVMVSTQFILNYKKRSPVAECHIPKTSHHEGRRNLRRTF